MIVVKYKVTNVYSWFLLFYKNFIINVYCVSFSFFRIRNPLPKSCYILRCVFKNKKIEMFIKQLFEKLYSQCKHIQYFILPFFIQRMITMFNRIILVKNFLF